MKKSPVSLVEERFESKDKLVQAIGKLATEDLWIDRVNSGKGLSRVANSKLIRLHDLLTDAKSRFGSRAKLIDGILELEKRNKDAGYKTRLEGYALPRLLDLHGSLSKRSNRADAKANAKDETKPKAAKVKATAAKKAPAKKAPAKKVPSKKGAKSSTGKKSK